MDAAIWWTQVVLAVGVASRAVLAAIWVAARGPVVGPIRSCLSLFVAVASLWFFISRYEAENHPMTLETMAGFTAAAVLWLALDYAWDRQRLERARRRGGQQQPRLAAP